MSETLTLDVSEKDKIFVVQEKPYFVAVVNPKENRDVKTRPGFGGRRSYSFTILSSTETISPKHS